MATDTLPSQSRFTVIAEPGGKRARLFAEALRARGLPAPDVRSWRDVARGPLDLDADSIVRVDSPDGAGDALLAEGADHPELGAASRIRAVDVATLPPDPGRLRFLRQSSLGMRRLLRRMAPQLHGRRSTHDPAEIELMFDKEACHARLAAAGIPVPPRLPGASTGAALLQSLDERTGWRAFVKPRWGSSAAGMVALQGMRGQVCAWTHVHRGSDGAFYSTKRLEIWRDRRQILSLLDFLCAEGVHVEAWVPKARFQGRACDLRVLAIGGEVAHVVPRLSLGPMTNLHLDAQRGDRIAARDWLGAARWDEMEDVCRRVASEFPRSLCIAVDVLIAGRQKRALVAEVNAFGDLLPGARHRGRDPYGAQIDVALARWCP